MHRGQRPATPTFTVCLSCFIISRCIIPCFLGCRFPFRSPRSPRSSRFPPAARLRSSPSRGNPSQPSHPSSPPPQRNLLHPPRPSVFHRPPAPSSREKRSQGSNSRVFPSIREATNCLLSTKRKDRAASSQRPLTLPEQTARFWPSTPAFSLRKENPSASSSRTENPQAHGIRHHPWATAFTGSLPQARLRSPGVAHAPSHRTPCNYSRRVHCFWKMEIKSAD